MSTERFPPSASAAACASCASQPPAALPSTCAPPRSAARAAAGVSAEVSARSCGPRHAPLPTILAMATITIATATTLVASSTSDAEWPAWRGPQGTGISSSALPPTIDPKSPRWRATPPGTSTSTPIVVGGKLFLTSQLGRAPLARPEAGQSGDGDATLTFLTLAYDFTSGRELWRREITSQGELTPVHTKHNLASPSPASDGERVIVWFGTGQIASYGLDGALQWQRHLGEEISPFELRWAHGSSPVIVGDRVLLLCDHFPAAYLLALDKRTGKEVWRSERGKEKRAYSTPLVIPHQERGEVVVVNANERIDAYDPATGELVWWADQPNRVPVPSPVWHEGVLYTSRGYRSGPYMAIDTSGSPRGDISEKTLWRNDTGAPYVPSLLHHDGLLYLATENGVLTVVDAKSGEEVYRQRMGSGFSASPIVADGKIVLANEDGELFVIAGGRSYQEVQRVEFDERIMASPVAVGGRLVMRTDGELLVF